MLVAFKKVLRKFSRDEAGSLTIEVVMILALAVMVVMGIYKVVGVADGSGDTMLGGIKTLVTSLLNFQISF